MRHAAFTSLPARLPGAAANDVEFALRRDPRQRGPATPQDALHELRLQAAMRAFERQPLQRSPSAIGGDCAR